MGRLWLTAGTETLAAVVLGSTQCELSWGLAFSHQVKLLRFAGDMILYVESLKDATRKLLELINKFSKVAGHKINTQ